MLMHSITCTHIMLNITMYSMYVCICDVLVACTVHTVYVVQYYTQPYMYVRTCIHAI